MAKILGLDLGTNSIGWAILDDDKDENKLEDKGVLIFTEGVKKVKGQEKSKAAERTGFRSARRLNFRRKIRKYQTLLVLAKYKMCPLTIDEVIECRKSNFKRYPTRPEFLKWLTTDDDLNINPYYYRDKSSRKNIGKYELGRALYHIAQRRGFLSNRLDQTDDNLIKLKKDEIQDLINNDSLNKIELLNEIETVFESYELKEKNKKDCVNATEEKLWSIRKYIINVIENKIKGKDYSKIEEVKKEIGRYINKPENLGAVEGNITELNKAIKDANCKTLGQYFWKLYQEDRNNIENKIRNNYTSREEHYLEEFEIICKAQELESIDDSKKDANERYSGIVKEFYKAIFYQRPLKSQKGLIGKCSLEPNRTRCSVSRPEFEKFRMYSFINTIKLKAPEDEKFRFLNQDEKEKITSKFYRKSKPTFAFEDIKSVLGKECFYNYKDKATVSGCPTIANLKIIFGDDWKNVIYKNYTNKTIKNRKTGEVIGEKTKDDVITDVWHVLSTYTSEEKLKDFALNKLNLNIKAADKFAKIHLKKDYANLSLYAINKILPYLKAGLLYSHAVFMANINTLVKPERWKNKEDRTLIENEVGEIINHHQEENKLVFVINSLLQNCFNNNFNYSKEAESSYKTDLEKALKKEFGVRNWSTKSNKEQILSNAFEKFIQLLKECKHLKTKRIDEKILEFLSDNDLLITEKANKLYHPSDIEKFSSVKLKDREGGIIKINGKEVVGLGSPDVGSIKNPMAMKALHQLKKLINALIIEGQIDENTKINIELSRQLNDANKRKAIEKWQNDKKELYQEYKKKIKELYKKETGDELKEVTNSDIEKFTYALEQREDGKIVSKEDILKYTLWKEQNHICIYTGKTIRLSSFLGANPTFDIEHTLPRSRSWDNSKINKTLCENKFNRDTKKDSIPTELPDKIYNEILPRIKHWKDKYESLNDEIEKLIRQSRNATDKEKKDRFIQRRHYLKMEYNYWKGKYSRFTMEEIKDGFKNSQAVDIGIISKYSRAYLKSVFKKVYSVKGEMVAEYRKAWGLHDTFKDKWGRTQYKPKDRSNHIHHCIDAVTIAAMNKNKYDKLAHAWGLEDKGDFNTAKKELENEKPWKTFTEDVRNLENEVFIVHQNRDILPIQTKKFERKRGKIQYVLEYEKDNNGNYIRDEKGKKIPQKDKEEKLIYKLDENGKRIPKIQQGDTVRGPLHLDTFYGAIAKDKEGIIKKDDNDNIIPNYVVRKELSKLKKSDVAKIIDANIKAIVEQAQKEGLISFNKNGAKVSEEGIWQNKEKQIPLKKVRIYTPSVKSPLKDFKKHATPFLSKKEYKQQYNVVNEENYCLAIYEGVNDSGKIFRDKELVNNIEGGNYYKLSNSNHRREYDLVPNPHEKSNLSLKYILKKGLMILIYKISPDEIWELSQTQLLGRLFEITQLDVEKSAEIKLLHHQEAREKKEITLFMGLKTGMKGGKNIDNSKQFPWIKVGVNKFDCLVEGYDFKITPTSKIIRI
ncbi:MAG: type II CRISPR RNA-guided endonuclease Cas9 [Flavobacteriaceae bacterium]|nr:type II CRISPR RNA-guided endonuclease Cas9 [Flavobacteriaceae bacterium]